MLVSSKNNRATLNLRRFLIKINIEKETEDKKKVKLIAMQIRNLPNLKQTKREKTPFNTCIHKLNHPPKTILYTF